MAKYSTISINDNNDIFLDAKGNIAFADDIDALVCIVKNVAQTASGELKLHTNLGVPYFQTVFISPPNLPLWAEALSNEVLRIIGVESITDFQYTVNENILNYTMTVNTEFGETVING